MTIYPPLEIPETLAAGPGPGNTDPRVLERFAKTGLADHMQRDVLRGMMGGPLSLWKATLVQGHAYRFQSPRDFKVRECTELTRLHDFCGSRVDNGRGLAFVASVGGVP